MDTIDPKHVKAGDEVFVLYHNPHVPSVVNVKAAEIVPHPKDPNAVALFLHETFHLIEEDDALYKNEGAALQAYKQHYQQNE